MLNKLINDNEINYQWCFLNACKVLYPPNDGKTDFDRD